MKNPFVGRLWEDESGVTAVELALVASFIRWKREGFVPDRDLVMVLTADEETSSESIKWLLAQHRSRVEVTRMRAPRSEPQ